MMRYLKQSWITFLGFFRRPAESSFAIAFSEPLTRYILSRSHFASPSRVKFNAFMPPPDLELSVFRISGLTESAIWTIGSQCVAQPANRTLHARADILVSSVVTIGLEITPDNQPKNHATVTGWPEELSARQLLAMELAAAATLRLPPNGYK